MRYDKYMVNSEFITKHISIILLKELILSGILTIICSRDVY